MTRDLDTFGMDDFAASQVAGQVEQAGAIARDAFNSGHEVGRELARSELRSAVREIERLQHMSEMNAARYRGKCDDTARSERAQIRAYARALALLRELV